MFTSFVNGVFAAGSLGDDLRQMWGSCVAIALTKAAGGYRPISMGNVVRRITGRAALHAHKLEILQRFCGVGGCTNLQLGCMSSNGSETVIHDLALHMELHPGHTLLHVDCANAFNTQHQFAFLEQVHVHFPALLPLAAQFYTHSSDLEGLLKEFPNVLVRAICDDVHLAGPDAEVAAAYLQMQKQMAAIGLLFRYSPRKTCCWSPSFPQGPSEADKAARAARSALPAATPRLAGGMHVLGSFVGTDDFVRAAALAHAEGADASSIRSAVDAVFLMAVSEARNPRDIAGTLLRVRLCGEQAVLPVPHCPPGPLPARCVPRGRAVGGRLRCLLQREPQHLWGRRHRRGAPGRRACPPAHVLGGVRPALRGDDQRRGVRRCVARRGACHCGCVLRRGA